MRNKNKRNMPKFLTSYTAIVVVIIATFVVNILKTVSCPEPIYDQNRLCQNQNIIDAITTMKNIIEFINPLLWTTTVAQLISLCKNNDFKTDEIVRDIESIDEKLIKYDNVTFDDNKEDIDAEIKSILSKEAVRRMNIICYGTGYFGETLNKVIEHNKDCQDKISVDLVICSHEPQGVEFGDGIQDKEKLLELADDLKKDSNITVHISCILPTIRACIIRDKSDNVIFCYYQPYYIFPPSIYDGSLEVPRGTLLHAKGSPMIIARKNDTRGILYQLVKTCEDEFNRLKSSK